MCSGLADSAARGRFLTTVISPPEVGSILFIGSIITTVMNPMISTLADTMMAQKALVLSSTLGMAISGAAMLIPGQGYLGMLIWNTVHSLAGAHYSPTFDASTMAVCPEKYGDIRLIGSAAFGFAAFGGGALMSLVPQKLTFLATIGAASVIEILSLPLNARLDFTSLHAKKPTGKSGGKSDSGPKVAELIKSLIDPKMLFAVVVTFMAGWQSSLIDTFFNVHMCAASPLFLARNAQR